MCVCVSERVSLCGCVCNTFWYPSERPAESESRERTSSTGDVEWNQGMFLSLNASAPVFLMMSRSTHSTNSSSSFFSLVDRLSLFSSSSLSHIDGEAVSLGGVVSLQSGRDQRERAGKIKDSGIPDSLLSIGSCLRAFFGMSILIGPAVTLMRPFCATSRDTRYCSG